MTVGDFMMGVLRGVGRGLMIPVRAVAVLVSRVAYPASILGICGGVAFAVVFALKPNWEASAMMVLQVVFCVGLFAASRAVLRAWSSPDRRPRVRVVYRWPIY